MLTIEHLSLRLKCTKKVADGTYECVSGSYDLLFWVSPRIRFFKVNLSLLFVHYGPLVKVLYQRLVNVFVRYTGMLHFDLYVRLITKEFTTVLQRIFSAREPKD